MELFRDYGKTAGIFAGAAFLLSLLVGAISRNPFGVVLLRALLFALLFALLGGGYRYLYVRFLSQPSGSSAEKAPEASGSAVDIVLPEEPATFESAAASGEDADAAEAEEVAEAEASPEDAGPAAPVAAGASAEDAGDLLDGESEEESGDELLPVMEEADSESAGAGDDQSGLDELPDLMDLDAPQKPGRGGRGGEPRSPEARSGEPGASAPRPAAPGSGRRRGASPGTPEEAVRNAVGEEDPASLARAIRTILKRDGKG